MSRAIGLLAVFLALATPVLFARAQDFAIGTGIYDITGPAGQINMMGYANPSQTTLGIQQRLFARAFVIVDQLTGERVVYVNCDLAFVTQIVKDYVLKRLQTTYGSLYTASNVGLTGTHTHGGPGGYAEYVLFEVTSLGFVEDNFQAIVDGIFQSIRLAHETVRPAYLFGNVGELLDSNINRSPVAYDNNPASEKAKYTHNVDKDMTLVKIIDPAGNDMGMINWFPVHCTSMNNTNRLVTPDNKGYAEYLIEKDFAASTNSRFVAAFSSSNLGDVSPNTGGPFCMDGPNKDLPCDYATSTCPNDRGMPRTQSCHNRGPAGSNDRENNRIIGNNQYLKAKELYATARQPLLGRLHVRQQYIDLPNYYANVNGTSVKLCRPAMGFSFAAGTCDGPGFLNFFQGDTNPDHPFWDAIVGFIKEPSEELKACQFPKPILLPTGEVSRPHDWHPSIIDFQMFVVGTDLVIMIVPGELSTMAGRRLRDSVRKTLTDGGVISADALVVVSGLASTYTHYIVTFEEYQIQRYEGASTIYGPNSLAAYIEIFNKFAQSIIANTTLPQGPTPPDFYDRLIRLSPQPKEDLQQDGQAFGAIKRDVLGQYTAGSKVSVLFYGANPRNNFMTGSTFLEVQHWTGSTWQVVRTDNDYDTEFRWVPLHASDAEQFISDIDITWFTDASVARGQYRIQYYGHSRSATGVITPFTGLSSTFVVV